MTPEDILDAKRENILEILADKEWCWIGMHFKVILTNKYKRASDIDNHLFLSTPESDGAGPDIIQEAACGFKFRFMYPESVVGYVSQELEWICMSLNHAIKFEGMFEICPDCVDWYSNNTMRIPNFHMNSVGNVFNTPDNPLVDLISVQSRQDR
jgi:hypothetical protein